MSEQRYSWPERQQMAADCATADEFNRMYQQEWPQPDALHLLCAKLEAANRGLTSVRLTNERMSWRVTPREFDELLHCVSQMQYKMPLVAANAKGGTLHIMGWKIEPTYEANRSDSYYLDRRSPRG